MKQKKWISGGLVLLGIALAIAASQLPPNWFTPDHLVNLSSVLTLISFTVRGILALRLLAIGAQLTRKIPRSTNPPEIQIFFFINILSRLYLL